MHIHTIDGKLCLDDIPVGRLPHEELAVIYSSVGEEDEALTAFLSREADYSLTLGATTPLPLDSIDYDRRTLGADRIAVVVGAMHLLQQLQRSSALIIDIGTAITYDFLLHGTRYVGGNIAPGPHIRLQALHSYTSRLPMVRMDEHTPVPTRGNDTPSALLAGVVNGISHELDGYISSFLQEHTGAVSFLTGGYANYFAKRIKNKTFVRPNLQMIGLKRILEYNLQLDPK